MKKFMLLTAMLWLNGILFAQNYQCSFDSLWQEDVQKDSSLLWKHQAHINRINHFRNLPQWNYQVIDTGIGTSGLKGGCSHALFLVPVVVHVVYDPNNPQSNLHDSLVEDQIRILNEGFSNTGIQFCLAQKNEYGNSISGIALYSNTASTHKMPSEISSLFSLSNFAGTGSDKYLNIYVVHTKSKII